MPTPKQLVKLALMLLIASVATEQLDKLTDRVTVLWPANGLLLGVLLLAPRRHWFAYFTVAYAVDFGVATSMRGLSFEDAILSLCNMMEVMIGLAALSRILPAIPDFTRIKQLMYLMFWGAIVAPAITTAVACTIATPFGTPGVLSGYGSWFTADSLGVATMTPLYIAFARKDFPRSRDFWEVLGIFALIIVTTLAVFNLDRYPFLFLITPVLLLAGVRLGLLGASLGLTIVSTLGGFMTSLHKGPVTLVPHATAAQHILVFQFFIASSICLLYGTEVLIRRNSFLQEEVAKSEARFRLLTEASRDIVILADLKGKRQYVSPAVTEVLGWLPEELLNGSYRDIAHPDDHELITRSLEDLGPERESPAISYRCRKPNGDYLWVEANVRFNRDPETNKATGLVASLRDISSRKAAEEKLQAAYLDVEALSTVDALTGVANRRRLDEVLPLEWRRALRDKTSISLLMLDADNFKKYNDHYGHLHGDECLRQIAEAASAVVQRPGDLIARFGGEEFVVVLPNTDIDASHEIAESIRRAVEALGMEHEMNPSGIVTVSVGAATQTPYYSGCELTDLIEAADRALYEAKRGGRNNVYSADAHQYLTESQRL